MVDLTMSSFLRGAVGGVSFPVGSHFITVLSRYPPPPPPSSFRFSVEKSAISLIVAARTEFSVTDAEIGLGNWIFPVSLLPFHVGDQMSLINYDKRSAAVSSNSALLHFSVSPRGEMLYLLFPLMSLVSLTITLHFRLFISPFGTYLSSGSRSSLRRRWAQTRSLTGSLHPGFARLSSRCPGIGRPSGPHCPHL